MSVLQTIRDKGAVISGIVIGLALLGFILTDYFQSRGMNNGPENDGVLGSVNGREIQAADFRLKVDQQEAQVRQQGQDLGEGGRDQIVQSVWESEVRTALLDTEIEELGITVGKKELTDYLFGNNPPQQLKQAFTDPATGRYDAAQVKQRFDAMSKGTPEDRANREAFLEGLIRQRKEEKYNALFSHTAYFPKWFIEKLNADNGLMAKTSYVAVPYTTISDSAVKVSDTEIKAYMEAHRTDYKQDEETRNIAFAVFPATPSAADSAKALQEVSDLKAGFAAAPDAGQFVTANASVTPFADQYFAGSRIQIAVKDSIFALPNGGVYGPYYDAGTWVIAKKIDSKVMPDSAKVRHILVGLQSPSGITRTDTVAHALADSLNRMLAAGASFDTLVARYSDDAGSKDKGGVFDYFPQGQMVPEFNDVAFGKAPGTRSVVKTQFGYHIVEVLGQKGSQPNYKVAYLSRSIAASAATQSAAAAAASRFAASAGNAKAFNDAIDKGKAQGIAKLVANDVKKSDVQIQGIGPARNLVRLVFETDKGEITKAERVGTGYVVALVTDVTPAGLQSVTKARESVEPVLRNQKKAKEIVKKLGNITTLEAAAAASGQAVQVADSLRFAGGNATFGFEPQVVGAAFHPAWKGKVVPKAIEGQTGVYVLRVESVGAMPTMAGSVEEQRRNMSAMTRQQAMYRSPVDALRQSAKIVDKRSTYY